MEIPESTLKKRTIELFATLPRSISNLEVARETGLSATWIQDFVHGRILDPSVNKVEHLYNYLSKKQLELV